MVTLDAIRSRAPQPFQHPDHEPFLWQREQEHGALLLHGFPGTPAEMRGVGQVLYDAGWSVYAPLLPGFGPAIETLASRTYQEWLECAIDAFDRLRRNHRQILLVGNSMGGALALVMARTAEPAGLIAAAPFTRLAAPWQRCLWPLLYRLVPHLKPFERADMASPNIRRLVRRMFDNGNVNDPVVQSFIRKIAVPTRAIDQVCRLGRLALRAAPDVRTPMLLMQGSLDRVVAPQTTRALAKRLAIRPVYHEFETGHDVIETDAPSWPQVEKRVREFANGLKRRPPLTSSF
jgi:carboxylesterase